MYLNTPERALKEWIFRTIMNVSALGLQNKKTSQGMVGLSYECFCISPGPLFYCKVLITPVQLFGHFIMLCKRYHQMSGDNSVSLLKLRTVWGVGKLKRLQHIHQIGNEEGSVCACRRWSKEKAPFISVFHSTGPF